MQPEIFYLNENYCCLIYQDYLVVNVPINEVEECMGCLDRGHDCKFPRGSRRLRTGFMNVVFRRSGPGSLAKAELKNIFGKEQPVSVTFKLDQKFRLLVISGGGGKVFLDRKPDSIVGDPNRIAYLGSENDATFEMWLDVALLKLGFEKTKSLPTKKRFWLESLGGLLLWFILGFIAVHNVFPSNLKNEILIAIVIAVIGFVCFLLWDLRSPPRERTKYFLK